MATNPLSSAICFHFSSFSNLSEIVFFTTTLWKDFITPVFLFIQTASLKTAKGYYLCICPSSQTDHGIVAKVNDSPYQTFLCFRIDALNTCTLAGVGCLFLTQMWKWMSPVPQSKSTGTLSSALLYSQTKRLRRYRGVFVHSSFTKEALIQPRLACCFLLGCLLKKKKKKAFANET